MCCGKPWLVQWRLQVHEAPPQVQIIEKVLLMGDSQHEFGNFETVKERRQLTLPEKRKKNMFLDVLDLNKKWHAADNISSQQSRNHYSPSMLFLIKCRLIKKENIHILKPFCALHISNFVAKKISIQTSIQEVFKHQAKNKGKIIFSSNFLWLASGDNMFLVFRKPTISSTFFKPSHHVTRCQNLIKLIEDWGHFTANEELISHLQPLVDAIAYLECSKTNLSNMWKKLIEKYKKISNADRSNSCLILPPSFQIVAVSKKHTIGDIYVIISFYSKSSDKPLVFLAHSTPNSKTFKNLEIGILDIFTHVAGVEGLFF
ncbi:hypothetical protein VP01_2438g1 [Puccinia sorghi]|uniref:Uncharacterized protein n=1 Tax=Puccinia sorghi TaxID=27349 RepID=A0A0L6V6C2_9BASI|nr:hypothetical protein VP01_2438g1 [Puccinia sorghi]